MISRSIVILRNEKSVPSGPLSRRHGTIIPGPTDSRTGRTRAMKLKHPYMAMLLLVVLTTGFFPTMVLSRDRDNDHQHQSQSTRNGGVPWNALSSDEQAALKDYRRSWTKYSPEEQNKLRRGANRYLNLPPRERDAVKRKQQQYQNMSPQEREQLREKYRKQRN